MKVTPINRKFGRYAPGEEFELPDKAARIFIKAKKLQEVGVSLALGAYMTRDMRAAAPAPSGGLTVAEFVQGSYLAKDNLPAGLDSHGAATEIAAATAAQEAPSTETDSAGATWDEKLHVATKLKNGDGTWRKRPGARVAD